MKKLIYLSIIMLTIVAQVDAKKRKAEVITKAQYGISEQGTSLVLKMDKGKKHNHPLMAIWLADSTGQYIQTLYVAESIGKGYFDRSVNAKGKWQPGATLRPATLPFWAYQRGIKNDVGNFMPTQNNPVVDAYTGATPPGSFELTLVTDKPLSGKYKIMMEINQSWDWNEFWFNDKFPEDKEYKTSSQPAVIYEAVIDTQKPLSTVQLIAVGRSHHSGQDGKMYTDLNTLTTALQIVKKATITIK
jgi:hypothetical protein